MLVGLRGPMKALRGPERPIETKRPLKELVGPTSTFRIRGLLVSIGSRIYPQVSSKGACRPLEALEGPMKASRGLKKAN